MTPPGIELWSPGQLANTNHNTNSSGTIKLIAEFGCI